MYAKKNILIVSAILICACSAIKSQSYYYQKILGIDETIYQWSSPAGATKVLSSNPSDKNDVLSSTQNLPFNWNFYGLPVSQYKVSDNGYITFDITAATSYSSNGSLPDANGPNKAIYAFWDDFELKTYATTVYDEIITWTYGTQPDRVHVIQWNTVTPIGTAPSSNYASFAIRIYEAGGFDIVNHYGRKNNVALTGGTIGVENANGTQGSMVSGSPNASIAAPPMLAENMVVYKFIYGVQPNLDMAGIKLSLPEIAASGTSVNISGEVINYGVQTITSMDINYIAGSGNIQTQHKTGLNISNNTKYSFTHNIPWTATGTGNFHTIIGYISNLNGTIDNDHSNDTLQKKLFVNNGVTAPKKVLIEEFSTVPCQYCPDGTVILENVLDTYPNAIGVTHHAGYLTDAMTISASEAIASEFASGAPSAGLDRVLWPGEREVAISRSMWVSKTASQLNKLSPVDVDVQANWNSSTRQLYITAVANFVDYAYPGDLRMNVFIVEDSVTGTGSGYNQVNAYNTVSGHPMFGKGNPIIGYVHRHVIRAVLDNSWGTAGIISSAPTPGQSFSKNYTYTVPASYKENSIHVIAFVSYYDQNGKREILNSEIADAIASTTNINEITNTNIFIENIYPNPANEIAALNFHVSENSVVALNAYNALGQEMEFMEKSTYTKGTHTLYINTNEYPPGIYTVVIKSGNNFSTKKILITK